MKNTPIHALIFTLLIAGAGIAHARIGETEAQIKARFGDAVQTYSNDAGVWPKEYRFNDFLILVSYVKGRSYSEMYKHVDGASLTDAETEALLKANSSGGKWEKKTNSPPFWNITKDDTLIAMASCDEKRITLTVTQKFNGDMSGF